MLRRLEKISLIKIYLILGHILLVILKENLKKKLLLYQEGMKLLFQKNLQELI